MEFAALASFAILVVAWIVAPDGVRRPEPSAEPPVPATPEAGTVVA